MTVSRLAEERTPNPGYRAFLANSANVSAHRRALHLGGRARADRRRAPAPPRRAAARPPRRRLSVPARRDVRVRARPRDVRGAAGHVPRRAGDLRDVRELRRGRAPLRARAARHARGAAQARPALRRCSSARGATRRGRTRSSCSPTTGRRRARRSSQRNGYGLDELVAALACVREASTPSPRATSTPRRPAQAVDEATRPDREEQRKAKSDVSERDVVVLGLGQPRPRLPDGAAAPDDARGDRGASPAAARRAPKPSPRRAGARAVGARRAGRARRGRHAQARRRVGRGRGPGGAVRRRARRTTCCAPTASSTSPTSWSTASTTR